MKNQVLSIEQMQVLKDLGLDTSKASMIWIKKNKCIPIKIEPRDIPNESFVSEQDKYPTFTLQDILEIMPKEIKLNGISYGIALYYYDSQYICDYINLDSEESKVAKASVKNYLQAAYKMLVWCLKEEYIKTNKEEKL